MKAIRNIGAAMAVLACSAGFSQNDASERSEAIGTEVTRGYLGRELVGIKPQIGTVLFNDTQGTSTSRGAVGFSAEYNAAKGTPYYLGPSTGLLYSHLGPAGSNFFGVDSPPGAPGGGANLLLFPVNAKIGYLFPGEFTRLSVRAGGNVIYRTVTNSVALSDQDTSPTATGSNWKIYPNVGADFEVGPVLVRPDWTITPGNDLVSLTLGAVFALG